MHLCMVCTSQPTRLGLYIAVIGLVHVFQAEFSKMVNTNKAPCKDNEDTDSHSMKTVGNPSYLVHHLNFCVGTYSHGDTSDLLRVGAPSTKELLIRLIHLQTNK